MGDKLTGFWVYNTITVFKWDFNRGEEMFRAYEIHMCKNAEVVRSVQPGCVCTACWWFVVTSLEQFVRCLMALLHLLEGCFKSDTVII